MKKASQPIAVFDIDGTIFRSSLLIEITNAMILIGAFPPEARNQYQKQYLAWRRRQGSYQAYLDKVVITFEKYIKDVKQETLVAMSDIVIANLAQEIYRYTRQLINQLRDNYFLLAISGSPSELVARFCQAYGFRDYKATSYRLRRGIYTGQARLGHAHKDRTLRAMVRKHKLSLKGSIGVGDSEGDIGFLKLVERPIAFNPNQALFKAASQYGWEVVVERKNMIYALRPNGSGSYRLA